MTNSTRSLASLLRDSLQTLEYRKYSGAPEDPDYLLLSQDVSQTHPKTHPHAPKRTPRAVKAASEEEVRDYLTSLAKAYDLPTDFVQAVAKTESTFDTNKVHKNPPSKGKHGKPVPASTDYGLMQVNSRRIGHDVVEGPERNKFKIGEDVKSDWKANARAGVAILAEQYKVAEIEQGAVTSEKDRAQQAYSGYNGGNGSRDRYLHETRDGLPRNKNDKHFLQNYLDEKRNR